MYNGCLMGACHKFLYDFFHNLFLSLVLIFMRLKVAYSRRKNKERERKLEC
ncbi:hypothetical protein BACFIN_08804 [Bacteroides finegoldii DSM 17565]|nr:hypothetical protein BACFIN_08804 [Bacteroides finegoldii DSM 17565]